MDTPFAIYFLIKVNFVVSCIDLLYLCNKNLVYGKRIALQGDSDFFHSIKQ